MFYLHMNSQIQEIINKLPLYYQTHYNKAQEYNQKNPNNDNINNFNLCIEIIKESNYTIIPPIRADDTLTAYFPRLYKLIHLMKTHIENWQNHYPKASEIRDNIIYHNYEIYNPFTKGDDLSVYDNKSSHEMIKNPTIPSPEIYSIGNTFKNKVTHKKARQVQEQIYQHTCIPFINCDIPALAHKINNSECKELRPFNKTKNGNYKLNEKSIFFENTNIKIEGVMQNIYKKLKHYIFDEINAHALTVLMLDSIFLQTVATNRFGKTYWYLDINYNLTKNPEKNNKTDIEVGSFNDNDLLVSYDIDRFIENLKKSNKFVTNHDYEEFLKDKYEMITKYDDDKYKEFYTKDRLYCANVEKSQEIEAITQLFCQRSMTLYPKFKECLSEFAINKDEPEDHEEPKSNDHEEPKSNDHEEPKQHDHEEPKSDDHEEPTVKFSLITWIWDNPLKSFIAILVLLFVTWIIFNMWKPEDNEIKLNIDQLEDNEIKFSEV
jgi:hypothetical protein